MQMGSSGTAGLEESTSILVEMTQMRLEPFHA